VSAPIPGVESGPPGWLLRVIQRSAHRLLGGRAGQHGDRFRRLLRLRRPLHRIPARACWIGSGRWDRTPMPSPTTPWCWPARSCRDGRVCLRPLPHRWSSGCADTSGATWPGSRASTSPRSLINWLALNPLVIWLEMSPKVAQTLIVVFQAFFSWFAHKHFLVPAQACRATRSMGAPRESPPGVGRHPRRSRTLHSSRPPSSRC
jgi:hypothetical protein